MDARVELTPAHDPALLPTVRALFEEYGESLGFELCFQSFAEELRTLPGRYAPPAGRLLLACRAGEAIGCGALRALSPNECEMKRLYVRPAGRGLGVGRSLAKRLIAEARAIGYHVMRLDTLHTMTAANRLYDALGFRETPPYCFNPLPAVRYLALNL